MKDEVLVAVKMSNLIFCADAMRMEAVCSSETLVSTYKSTRRYNPENEQRHRNRISERRDQRGRSEKWNKKTDKYE
jgi:hypothetical protein